MVTTKYEKAKRKKKWSRKHDETRSHFYFPKQTFDVGSLKKKTVPEDYVKEGQTVRYKRYTLTLRCHCEADDQSTLGLEVFGEKHFNKAMGEVRKYFFFVVWVQLIMGPKVVATRVSHLCSTFGAWAFEFFRRVVFFVPCAVVAVRSWWHNRDTTTEK